MPRLPLSSLELGAPQSHHLLPLQNPKSPPSRTSDSGAFEDRIRAMDAQRALLDELMGSARNMTDEEKKGYKEVCWDDKEACGFYMVRFCPHDLFVNTRSDLGLCPRIHDPKLKESFEKSPRHDSFVPKFEAELAQFCEKLVMDLDRRVRRGRERLAQEEVPPPPPPISAEKSEQLVVLEEKIKKLLEQVESLGEAGKVDEAEALMKKVEVLNVEKTILTQPTTAAEKALMLTQEKKMALCEICGSFLIANDAAERTQSHVTGKQHIGYGMIRDFLAEYKEFKEKAREDERLRRQKEAEERAKSKEKENESRSRRHVADERDRSRERDRNRDRDGERDKHRDRSSRGDRDADRRTNFNRNGRDTGRDRYHERNGRIRSRSRSPRNSYRKSSRSPSRRY